MALTVLAFGGMRVPEELSGLLTHSTLTVGDALNSLRTSSLHRNNDGNEQSVAVWKEGEDGNGDAEWVLQREQLLQKISQSGIRRRVHLKIEYVSGEEIQTLPGTKTVDQIKGIFAADADWRGWLSSKGDLWLWKKVDDLSPACKKNAYMGVDEQGNLTLFKGPPADEEVLKTFFQMDIGTMKSSLPDHIWKQLQDGIRIQDIEEYNSVLSTFSDYSRDTAEEVMQSKE